MKAKVFTTLISALFIVINHLFCENIESSKYFLIKDINPKVSDINIPQNIPILPKIDAKYSSKAYSYVNMYINVSPYMKEIRGNDYKNGIDVTVREAYKGRFDANIRVDGKYESFSISDYNGYLTFSNAYGNLRASRTGDNYYVNGNIRGDDGKYYYVNATIYKKYADEYSYDLNSTGINLDFSKYSVNGNFNDQFASKKVVAYLISMVFSMQIQNIK